MSYLNILEKITIILSSDDDKTLSFHSGSSQLKPGLGITGQIRAGQISLSKVKIIILQFKFTKTFSYVYNS